MHRGAHRAKGNKRATFFEGHAAGSEGGGISLREVAPQAGFEPAGTRLNSATLSVIAAHARAIEAVRVSTSCVPEPGICLPYRRSRFSSGAPVPDEPTNSFFPSGKVMSRPLARSEPSFAWKPSTMILMPTGSEFLLQPRRISAFGAPPSTAHRSTFPSGPVASMWIQECGLVHSTLKTVPLILTGLFASNSAANEW